MIAELKRWGNSASIRIPAAIMEALRLRIDDKVSITEEGGKIIIEPVQEFQYDLAEMMSRVTPENIHERIDFGKPVGNELL